MPYPSPMRRFFLASSTIAAVLLACGGRVTTVDVGDAAAPDDGGADGGGSADGSVTQDSSVDGSGPCVKLPVHGTPCIPGQLSCDRVDTCCATEMVCDPVSKTWSLSQNDCLLCPTHACGDQTCQGSEMCITHPVQPGPATYECVPYPGACTREWTCICVEYNLPNACKGPAQGCADDKFPVTLVCD